MKIRSWVAGASVVLLVIAITACSNGGGGSSAPPAGSKPMLSSGIMSKGSVIVNGVRFDDTSATITGDDIAKIVDDLKDGMVVKVKGTRNDDGVTGTAQRVEIENEVRGTVTSVGTDTFTVLGQTVIVTSYTVTAGGWDFTLPAGPITGLSGTVEVHGERNTAGAILASRVEIVGASGYDELRGIVSGVTGTFSPGDALTVAGLSLTSTISTTILPIGASVVNGTLVEVHLSGTEATRIEVEDAEDAEFEPAEGQAVAVEGFVANLSGGDFDINGTHVHTTVSTRFEGGVATDVANDTSVEAEGHMNAGVLVAEKIAFKSGVRIIANPTSNGSANVIGITVYTTSATKFSGDRTKVGDILTTDEVEVRGFPNPGVDQVTATEVITKVSSAVAKPILQGAARFVTGNPAYTFSILGIDIDSSSVVPAEIKDDNGIVMTKDAFFSALLAKTTIVKVRGTYGGGTITADKMEIE